MFTVFAIFFIDLSFVGDPVFAASKSTICIYLAPSLSQNLACS